MDFIKLTFNDCANTSIYVNPAIITIMNKFEDGTRIEFIGNSYVYVKETPEEIMELINKL